MAAEYMVLRTHGRRARAAHEFEFPRSTGGLRDEDAMMGPSIMGDAMPMPGPIPAAVEPEEVSLEVETLEDRDVQDLARDPDTAAVAQSMDVRLIEPMALNDDELGFQPADAEDGTSTWGVRAVGAVDSPVDGSGVIVAVLDTGVNEDHDAFNGIDVEHRDFTDTGVQDDIGHGTHCAATICGRPVGGVRIGVAPGVTRLLSGKVLTENRGDSAWVASAIQWALGEGAHVISMSLGIDFPGFVDRMVNSFGVPANVATARALKAYRQNLSFFRKLAELVGTTNPMFNQRGALLVAASGNESNHPQWDIEASPPAASENISAVGAVGLDSTSGMLRVAPFSNSGVNLVGPGVNVLSADHQETGGLVAFNGTSMATPHVAGVAALWVHAMQEAGLGFDVGAVTAKVLGQTTRQGIAQPSPLLIGSGLVQAPR